MIATGVVTKLTEISCVRIIYDYMVPTGSPSYTSHEFNSKEIIQTRTKEGEGEMNKKNSEAIVLKSSLDTSTGRKEPAISRNGGANAPRSGVVDSPDPSDLARTLDWWKRSMHASDKNLFDDHDPDPIIVRHMSLPQR